MKPSLQLKLSQHLALTPQLQQSIKLLQLSTLELNQEIEKILLENPMLEREEPEGDLGSSRIETPGPVAPAGSEAGSRSPDWTRRARSPASTGSGFGATGASARAPLTKATRRSSAGEAAATAGSGLKVSTGTQPPRASTTRRSSWASASGSAGRGRCSRRTTAAIRSAEGGAPPPRRTR